jgi:hypothetical protein
VSRIDRIIQRVKDDVAREKAAERRANEADAARTEQPEGSPTTEDQP